MKCPKCGYLGFDHVDRCRNCGYDFSLAAGVTAPELPLRSDPQTDGFADLSLAAPRPPSSDPTAGLDTDFDRILGTMPSAAIGEPGRAPVAAAPASPARPESAAVSTSRAPAAASVPRTTTGESGGGALPLFGGPITDDVPLITKASPPRPPLSVRRATPEVPRVRAEAPRAPAVDLRLDLQVPEPPASAVEAASRGRSSWRDSTPEPGDDAGLGARLAAAAIDLAVLAVVDALVIYFTVQICGLTLGDAGILPKVPLLAYLAVQNGGYFVAFTAGGQTLGKMATGIRVVTAGSGSSLDLPHAALRTVAWVALAVPAGLGFLPAVFSADHRGLHDRFAGSRVIRASA